MWHRWRSHLRAYLPFCYLVFFFALFLILYSLSYVFQFRILFYQWWHIIQTNHKSPKICSNRIDVPCTFIALCCHNPKCQSKQRCCRNPYTKITKSLPIRNQYSQFCRKFIMFIEMFYFIFSIKYTSFSNRLFSFEYNLSFILAKWGIHKTKINIINSPKKSQPKFPKTKA